MRGGRKLYGYWKEILKQPMEEGRTGCFASCLMKDHSLSFPSSSYQNAILNTIAHNGLMKLESQGGKTTVFDVLLQYYYTAILSKSYHGHSANEEGQSLRLTDLHNEKAQNNFCCFFF